MQLRRVAVIVILALGLVAPLSTDRSAEARSQRSSRSDRASKKSEKVKVCTTKKGKRSCKRVLAFQGHGVGRSSLRAEPLDRPSGDVWVYSANVRDEAKLNIYAADGTFDEASLARLDEIFRCRRSNEARAVDPRLYEMLSRVFDHFGQRRIELVSGFRFLERDSSRHHHASAMDIRIPGVTINEMYAFAETLDQGGMGVGIYPNSGFVHIDFRAPGEPSYRWTDRSGPDREPKRSKRPTGRTIRAKKPTS